MWGRIPIQGTLLATAITSVTLVGAQLTIRYGLFASPVEALNYCIQKRFHTLDGFGMARMPVVPQHVYEFAPETSEEQAAVAELQQKGWSVGLYLGGRGLLESPMTQAEWEKVGKFSDRKAISEPLRISGKLPPTDLPKPWELWKIGQRALVASTTSDQYQASFDRWWVDARPIRANQKACFKCHAAEGADGYPPRSRDPSTELKIGDALGVVIYVYARTPK